MNASTTLIVEAPASSTGVILGGVSLGLVLSSLLGLAIYVLRKGGVVTAQQVEKVEKVAEEVLKSPVVAEVVPAQVVEIAKEVVKETPLVEKSIAASETSINLHV